MVRSVRKFSWRRVRATRSCRAQSCSGRTTDTRAKLMFALVIAAVPVAIVNELFHVAARFAGVLRAAPSPLARPSRCPARSKASSPSPFISGAVSADPDATPNSGRCTLATSRYDGTCREPRMTLTVRRRSTTVELAWADFTGGSPVLGINLARSLPSHGLFLHPTPLVTMSTSISKTCASSRLSHAPLTCCPEATR